MAGPIRIAILSNGRQARADIARTAGSLGVFSKTASRAGKVLAGAFAIGALVRVGKAVGAVGSSYVSSLNKIQALTGATDAKMGKLASSLESQSSAYARFGQTTGDAAHGMVELAKSGLSADKALRAIRGTMTLAKAGELEVSDASELVANTLNTFNLKASKAADIANSLANAANISSADVRDVAESFKYVAPLAAKANVTVDQTNALLAELANSGIKASQAGTSLRKFLLSLQAPTGKAADAIDSLGVSVYDAEGNMRPIGSLINQLRSSLGKLSNEGQNRALRDIFGLTGITGAQVILKGGVDGLKQYTKGVQRAGAATKLAESASKGLAGTLGSIKAQATSTVQELYRKYSPALDNALRGAITFLGEHKQDIKDLATSALPALEKVGSLITDHVAPALESIGKLALHTAQAFGSGNGGLARTLANDLIDALGKFADLVKTAADGLDRLPGPIKAVGAEAAFAALVFPRFTAGVTSATTAIRDQITYLRVLKLEMADANTRGQQVSAMMSRLGGAARTAAGIGGMVALTEGAKQSNTALQALGNIGGGALLGFSVGGPVGAAVGGTAGALLTLAQNANKAGGAVKAQIPKFEGLKDTLDGLTAATTEATRAAVLQGLQSNGTLDTLNQYGISSRSAVSAILGESKARSQIGSVIQSEAAQRRAAMTEAMRLQREYDSIVGSGTAEENRRQELAKLIQGWKDEATAHGQVVDTIKKAIGTYKGDVRAKREEIAVSKDYTGLLKGLPKNVVSKVKADGIKPTMRDVTRYAGLIKNVDKKQIRTVLKAAGFEGTKKQIDEVRSRLTKLQTVKPDLTPALRSVQQASLQMKRRAIEGGDGVAEGLKRGTGHARADLGPFQRSLSSGINSAKGTASNGGQGIGGALGAGIYYGVGTWAGPIAARAAALVHAAVTAARAAGRIHSPSQEMRDKVGKPLAQGLILGFIHETQKGTAGVRSALDKLMGVINARLDGKRQADRRKALLKSLRDERAVLLANGKAQDRNNKALSKAVEKYKALRDRANEFAKSIRGGFVGFGSIVGLGTTGGGTAVSLPAILSQLTARANVADQFAAIIEKLRGKLNKTSLRQLLEQAAIGDLEGALATAQAVASGGSAAIEQINQLTAQIAAAGKRLGNKMRGDFYGAGLQAAEGLVEGLKKKQRDLDRVAERLAETLVKKVKKALGIKSPSRVFADIGAQTARGLQVGIRAQDTYVKRSGAVMAASLQKGFGTPALDAYLGAGGAASTPTFTVQIELTAQQLSEVEKGKRIQVSLDAYRAAGGRSKVRPA